ncbi:MAG TPA: ABC transporter ATP-binding protein [Candidatus Binatia bacterium]|nr:ABC transporter ATP-binding protein [Candidatus Binatia bacterium]
MLALRNLRLALGLLSAPQRVRWAMALPLELAGGIVEGVAAACIFGVTAVLANTSHVAELPLMRTLYVRLPEQWRDETTLVPMFLAATGAMIVLKLALQFGNMTYKHRVALQQRKEFSDRVYRAYLAAPFSFHLQRGIVDLVHRATMAESVVFEYVLGSALTIAGTLFMLAILLGVLLLANATVTVFTAAFVGGWVMLIYRITRKRLLHLSEATADSMQERNRLWHDGLHAIREIKILGREPHFANRYRAANDVAAEGEHRRAILLATPRLLLEGVFFLTVLATAAVFLHGPGRAALVPLLGLYVYAGVRVIPSAMTLAESLTKMIWASQLLERFLGDWNALDSAADPVGRDIEGLELREAIELRDVSYRYEGSACDALTGIDLRIERGQTIGIVGETGAGKSTLMYLLAGLLRPTSGIIEVDRRDLWENAAAWRRTIGDVSQEMTLLDDSIRGNVALGVAPDDIDEAAVRRSLAVAEMLAFVDSLPQGTATRVGANGTRLSGGQRQRVVLARALYHSPAFLLLDEAMSSLDDNTAWAIAERLHDMRGHRTVVMVAHHLVSLGRCDRIVMMERGRILAQGSFEDLVRTCPRFAALAGTEPDRGAAAS